MDELMKTKIFKVTVERLLLNGGQTLYMVGWSLLVGTIIGMILALILVLCSLCRCCSCCLCLSACGKA